MSFSPALVYDFIFLAVFSFAAVKSWQKGFLAGLTELIGAVLGRRHCLLGQPHAGPGSLP